MRLGMGGRAKDFCPGPRMPQIGEINGEQLKNRAKLNLDQHKSANRARETQFRRQK